MSDSGQVPRRPRRGTNLPKRTEAAPSPEVAEPEPPLDPRGVDPILRSLVALANSPANFEVGITVQVSGAIVAGVLVGATTYGEGWGDEFISLFPDETIGSAKQWVKLVRESLAYSRSVDVALAKPPRFIHLKDARVHFGGMPPVPANAGVWWRGRLADVNAWWLGRLTTPQDLVPEDEQPVEPTDDVGEPSTGQEPSRRRRPTPSTPKASPTRRTPRKQSPRKQSPRKRP